MKVPSFQHWADWSKTASLFASGMIIGAAVFMALNQAGMNTVLEDNARLRNDISMLQQNWLSRKEYGESGRLIHSILVFIEYDPKKEPLDETAESDIKRRVRTDLQVLLGRPVSDIAPPADNGTRLLKTLYVKLHEDIGGSDYLLSIENYVIVYGELRVWVTPKEYVKS